MYLNKQDWFRVLVTSTSKWILQKLLKDSLEANRDSKERLRQLLSDLQGKIHNKKKELNKFIYNNRQKAKASKRKASDIQNYSQIELDYSNKADSEVQKLYF